MKLKFFLVIIIFIEALFVSSCVSYADNSTLIPTYTFTVEPTTMPSSTPIPFLSIDLEDILIESGDLPIGYTSGQFQSPPKMFDDFIKKIGDADYSVSQQFAKNEKAAGGVTVFVYEDIKTVKLAYDTLNTYDTLESGEGIKVTTGTLSDVGEDSSYCLVETNILNIKSSNIEMVFFSCHSVVLIRITDTDDVNGLKNYATRLENRLRDFVCR